MSSYAAQITVLHLLRVSPPPGSVPPTSLPLTFFDLPWLLFPPGQPLFFFKFPTTTLNFTRTILPTLTHSLSLTLRQFFPLAAASPSLSDPFLHYSPDHSISVTVAESAADAETFNLLIIPNFKSDTGFYNLIPQLTCGAVLAVQITIFPDLGFSIGFALRHVCSDWRTFNNFLRKWASISSQNGQIPEMDPFIAFHDRSIVRDPNWLTQSILKDLWNISGQNRSTLHDDTKTRATFLISPKEMERIKKWILTRSNSLFGSTRLLLSPYVLACAFIWACWAKAQSWSVEETAVHHFGFIAGGVTRLPYQVPITYVGNCVGFGRCSLSRSELLSENGVAYCAKALGDAIEKLNDDLLGGAKRWVEEWEELNGSDQHLMVTGSPKVGLYGLDFGWGRPLKFEEVSIGQTGSVSLCDGREGGGSIEVGLAMEKKRWIALMHYSRKA